VFSVADLERRDVNFDLIKDRGQAGRLGRGHGAHQRHSDRQAVLAPADGRVGASAKIAIVTCPFEPPKPKTKYNLNIGSADDYRALAASEQAYFVTWCGASRRAAPTS